MKKQIEREAEWETALVAFGLGDGSQLGQDLHWWLVEVSMATILGDVSQLARHQWSRRHS